MSTITNTPERVMRERVAEHEDYGAAAEAVLAAIDMDDREAVTAWLRAGVYALARTVSTQVRMAETHRLAREHNGSPERVVVRIPITFGKERRFRSATLADCGKADLLTLAELLERQAEEDLRKATSYRRLARALERHGVGTVGELPADVIAGAFENHDTGRKVAA